MVIYPGEVEVEARRQKPLIPPISLERVVQRAELVRLERDPQELLLGVVSEVCARVPVRVNLRNACNLKMARVKDPHEAGQEPLV